ncbi:hypothetical protein PIROE2DRAFT_9832 [Piromyces sp. E2]|nr:hypothetical protein PIROE2DRAFT_9832 [Piromyces sp. E2]|eukprot:OUM63554.1 hypothetical protein PIROE2DRAFT_9832 [Piromyces sp. E2]
MKVNCCSLLFNFIFFIGLHTFTKAIKITELANNYEDIYFADKQVFFYNDTTGYPNEKDLKYENKNNLDPSSPSYSTSKFDVVKIAEDYIYKKYPDLDIVNVGIVNNENSLSYIAIFYHVLNNIPIINSRIAISVNGESGMIVNEEISVVENIKKVEKNDILNDDKEARIKKLVDDINSVAEQLELSQKKLNYEDVIIDKDYNKNFIFLKNIPFTSDSTLHAQLVYNCVEEKDNALSAKLQWQLKFYSSYLYYTVRYGINDGKVFSVKKNKSNYRFIKYNSPGDNVDRNWRITSASNPEIKNASPYGWNKIGNITYHVPFGNNVKVYSDYKDRSTFTKYFVESNFNFDFDYNKNYSNHDERNRNFAIINTFYMINTLHDIYFNLGFDEKAGNFQDINYTNEGKGNDSVIVLNYNFPSDDEGLTNMQIIYTHLVEKHVVDSMAFTTPEDGQHPVLYMHNIGYATHNHGLIHEYTHGVVGRYHQKAHITGDCFSGNEAGTISEGLSEFFASALAFQERKKPYTFGHLWRVTSDAYGEIQQSVYNRLEFFVGALTDALFLICGKNRNIDSHFKCDENLLQEFKKMKKNELPYNVHLYQVVLNASSHLKCQPTFTDWRDAIFTEVDNHPVIRNDKYFKCLLWISFANRGFGSNAKEEYTRVSYPENGIKFEQYKNNYDIPDFCMKYRIILDDNRMKIEEYTYKMAYNDELYKIIMK